MDPQLAKEIFHKKFNELVATGVSIENAAAQAIVWLQSPKSLEVVGSLNSSDSTQMENLASSLFDNNQVSTQELYDLVQDKDNAEMALARYFSYENSANIFPLDPKHNAIPNYIVYAYKLIPVDIEAISHFFDQLNDDSLRLVVGDTLANGIRSTLGSGNRLFHLMLLFISFHFPWLDDPSYLDLMEAITEGVVKLSAQHLSDFVNCICLTFDTARFRSFVQSLHQYISIRVFNEELTSVRNALRVLSIFSILRGHSFSKVLLSSDLINDVLSSTINSIEQLSNLEYSVWKKEKYPRMSRSGNSRNTNNNPNNSNPTNSNSNSNNHLSDIDSTANEISRIALVSTTGANANTSVNSENVSFVDGDSMNASLSNISVDQSQDLNDSSVQRIVEDMHSEGLVENSDVDQLAEQLENKKNAFHLVISPTLKSMSALLFRQRLIDIEFSFNELMSSTGLNIPFSFKIVYENRDFDSEDFQTKWNQICDSLQVLSTVLITPFDFSQLCKEQGISWNNYSFFSYPFAISMQDKSHLLSRDARDQMEMGISSEIRTAVFTGSRFYMPYFVLRVSRTHIVMDTLTQVLISSPRELKKPLKVVFDDEEGVDAGGVRKEFFQVMMRKLLDPNYGMFRYHEDSRLFWFNCDSLESAQEFELIGTLIALAVFNSIIIDLPLPKYIYKKLKHVPYHLSDLAEFQPGIARSLDMLLSYPANLVESDMNLTFQLSYEVFGETKTVDLIEQGGSIAVTGGNRREYVDAYLKYILNESIQSQYDAFERGFYKVFNKRGLDLFSEEELELIICGSPSLDFHELESGAHYEDGYEKDSPMIQQFWTVVHQFSEEEKRQLLKFVSGSDRTPIGGLATLNFVISRIGADDTRLPSAHTCFNHLLLPEYSSMEILEQKLKYAISHSEGFGLR